jgi:uncharacterized membrane protein
MEWYYAANGQQQGPVSDTEFARLIAAGIVSPNTLVWRAGMATWLPLSQLSAATAPEPPPILAPDSSGTLPGSGFARCSECGQAFPEDQLVVLRGSPVCGPCKPVWLQRLQEGVPGSGFSDGAVTTEELLAGRASVDLNQIFTQAWETFTRHWATLIPAAVMTVAVVSGLQILISNTLPSTVATLISALGIPWLSGPLTGGMTLLFLRSLRKEPAPLGLVVAGFGTAYLPLAIFEIIQDTILGILSSPLQGIESISGSGTGASFVLESPWMAGLGIIGLLVGYLIRGFWIFTVGLIIDKRMKFWPAMSLSWRLVSQRLGPITVIYLASGLIVVSGVVLFCVGVLATLPLAVLVEVALYEQVCGRLKVQSLPDAAG